jgi:hypothetical protein
VFNSFVMNLVVRMLMGGHVTTSLAEHLPVPLWTGGPEQRRIAGLARRLASSPGVAVQRVTAELEAEVAWLYGVSVADFQRILGGFPLVARTLRDEATEHLRRRRKSGSD